MPIRRILFAGLIALTLSGWTACDDHRPRPNILLIMTDDQGWGDAGFNGSQNLLTPHLDSLAAMGIVLDRFYSASAVCSPTRASCLTGRNPLRTDIPYANRGHLKEGEITLPELLRAQGYATAHFGKWHLGTLSRTEPDANRGGRPEFADDHSLPTQHGYDEYFATESKVPTYDPLGYPVAFREGESLRYGWEARGEADALRPYGTAYWIGENQRVTEPLEGDDARIIMDRVLPFVRRSAEEGKPFFATVWFHTPHLPVVSDSLHRQPYRHLAFDRQLYYGTLSALDEQMGRLWTTIEEQGLAEETILFFCSDNGPEVRTPGQAGPFRGRKRSLYEGGVRVPAFALGKGRWPGGRRIDLPMVTSDYLPTLLDLLKIPYPDDRPLDGISVLPALEGEARERASPIGFICEPHVSWVTHRYKLIGTLEEGDYELYDLLEDRSEQTDIIGRQPERARALEAALDAWRRGVENSRRGADYE